MKSKLLITILIAASTSNMIGQSTFQKVYGGADIDNANCIQQTSDNGFIATGTTSSIGAGSGDIFLLKTNAAGDTVFTKSYGAGADDSGYSVQQTTDGGYIVSGSTNSFGGNGKYDVYLIKTNSFGDTLWTKTIGGPLQEYGFGVKQTLDGGYIVTGIKQKTGVDNDIYLIKTNADGDTLWTKTYGSINHDQGYAVQQTTDGGYIIAGEIVFGAGSADFFLIKTNAVGDTLWTKAYGGVDVDWGYAIQQTTDGGYIVGGHTQMGSGSWDALLIKTDGNGNLQWSKTFGGAGVDNLYSVQQTTDGGYVFGGSTNSFGSGSYNLYLVKTNSIGDALWTKTYGGTGEDRGYYAVQTADGGYAIAGYTIGLGVGTLNLYLVKTDANGNSQCNDNNTATLVTTAPAQLSTTDIVVANPSSLVAHSATVIQSGATVTVLCTSVGLDDINIQNNTISIYPNPFTNAVTVKGTKEKESITIFDLMGKTILMQVASEGETKINTESLLPGFYILRCLKENKAVEVKLVKL